MNKPGCPHHRDEFSRECLDFRCQMNWEPEGAPSPEDQLAMWVDGRSVCPNKHHECCPDFSCCRPHLRWPQEIRIRFAAAGPRDRERMMVEGIAGLLKDAAPDKKVYIAAQSLAKAVGGNREND